MKLKSLFLTSMVALALGACSNATEDVANNTTEKNASLSFSIALPSSTTSRANSGDEIVADKDENTVNTIYVRVKYSDNTSESFSFEDVANQFVQNGNLYTLKDALHMQVKPDANATIYVTVNNSNTDPAGSLSSNGTALDYLTGTNDIANSDHFKMSGYQEHVVITANVGPSTAADGTKVNTADVNVYRTAAKLQELSTEIPAQGNTISKISPDGSNTTDLNSASGETLSVKLLSYSFLNLSTKTNIYPSGTAIAKGAVILPEGNSYLQSCLFDGNSTTDYFANSKTIGGSKVTYCLENTTSQPTYVVYKAQIMSTAKNATDATEVTSDCYVVKNGEGKYILYKSYADLNSANGNRFPADIATNYDELLKLGVIYYAGGVCYYHKAINTEVAAQFNSSTGYYIVRNNWYQLTVNSISGLGSPVVDPKKPSNPTLLALTVSVNPWIAQINTINF